MILVLHWLAIDLAMRFSCQNKLEMQEVEYIPGIYQVYTSMTRNTCTWYIQGIYHVYTLGPMLVYTWYIPGIYQV